MLDQIFMQVIDMSRIASVIILIVLIARLLLKKSPKFVSYVLWSVVLFRLLCPISFESFISLIPEMTPVSYHYTLADESISLTDVGEAAYQAVSDVWNGGSGVQQIETTELEADGTSKTVTSDFWEIWILLGQYVWLAGVDIMLLYSIISYYRLKKKLEVVIPLKENIYIADDISSPFVIGFIHPKIYLPNGLNEKEQAYIIMHEQFHIKRCDHIVKILAYTALCIHWFNPLVWLAFFLSSKDMEMSCDEAVIKRMGETIKADYSTSLLALAVGQRVTIGVPLAFGEGDTKERIKNIAAWKMPNKKQLSIISIAVAILMVCLMVDPIEVISSDTFIFKDKENTTLHVSMDLKEHYITNTGDPANLYYIDENNVLWGCGKNNYGQLGQGSSDSEYHDEMVKIAEDVIHVDYSQKGFVIYLTEDNELYGFGNSGCGALQQYDTFDWDKYSNIGIERYYVGNPSLLMENVTYARCGKDDIVCLTEDGSVWTWGTIYVNGGWQSGDVKFIAKPEKILENAVLITGGWFNHAALLEDGTVWTWGYNYTGNCGVADKAVVAEPTKVAEDVVMVWTGTMQYNIDCFDIYSFAGEYPRDYENTLIKKSDGSYWICGADVGTEERYIPFYYEVTDITIICTHEFQPINNTAISIELVE